MLKGPSPTPTCTETRSLDTCGEHNTGLMYSQQLEEPGRHSACETRTHTATMLIGYELASTMALLVSSSHSSETCVHVCQKLKTSCVTTKGVNYANRWQESTVSEGCFVNNFDGTLQNEIGMHMTECLDPRCATKLAESFMFINFFLQHMMCMLQ